MNWDKINEEEPTAFVWGSGDVEQVKKALLAHGFIAERLDEWLDRLSMRFPIKTPRKMIEDGAQQAVWEYIWRLTHA